MRILTAIITTCILLAGCVTTDATQPKITVSRNSKAQTMKIDSRDYNEIAKAFFDTLSVSKRVKEGKTLALGPIVQELDVKVNFDSRKFQEKLMTMGTKNGRYEFSFAVDAIKENDAAEARYNIMSLEFEKQSTVDPEDLVTFGTLANIDYIVFGRISSNTEDTDNGPEVTYTFNWKIGDCKTGLIVWADEYEMSKSRNTKEQ